MKEKVLNILFIVILISINYYISEAEVWELGDAEYLDNQLDISGQETDPKLMFWHADGDRFFMIGDISDRVHQYNVEIPWDINTASYSELSYDFSAQVTDPKGLFFKPDGMKMYLNDCWTDHIYQYSLSEPWDVTTLSYDGVSYHFLDQLTNPKSLYFKPDGTRCYIDCYAHDRIYQYDLSTPWDIGSISYNEESFYFHEIEDQPQQVSFRPDGLMMFLNGSGGNSIYRFSLGTAWDVTTAEYTEDVLDICAMNNDHAIRGHHFSPDGRVLYMIGCQHTLISQFRLEHAWELDEAYFTNNYNFVEEDGDVQNLTISSDGSRMFLQGFTNTSIYQYELSIPWDVRSAHYEGVNYNFAAEEQVPRGMYMKPDGSVLYYCGSDSDKIWQCNLALPWDLSTISEPEVFLDISAVEPNCRDLFIKPDGTKMYLAGATHCIWQFSMTTPWDISSAVYDGINQYTNGQTYNERGIYIKPDGSRLYMMSSSDDVLYEYTMEEPWDLSTLEYEGINLCLHYYEGDARDVFFKPEGDIMYFLGKGADRVYQFSLEQNSAPINYPPEINLPDSVSFFEDGCLEMDFTPYLYDEEGDAITLCCNGNENILVEIDSFFVSFSAPSDWNGMEMICFGARDDTLRSLSTDQLMVIVEPVDDIPQFTPPESIIFAEDSDLVIDMADFIVEVDNDPLQLAVSGVQNTIMTIDSLTVACSAIENWFGQEELVFSVSDGINNVWAEVVVEVEPVNDTPWLDLPDSLVFYSDAELEFSVLDYGGDVDNEELALLIDGNENTQVEISGLEVSISSIDNWLGSELLTFYLSDNMGRACCSDSVLVMCCPSGKPLINEICDRPADQGGFVYINFNKCYYDDVQFIRSEEGRSTEFYTIWSEIDSTWVALNTMGALGQEEYTILVPTCGDSVSIDPAVYNYRISAHMDEGTWVSECCMGYSLDNISPAAPVGLMISNNTLSWGASGAEDLLYYTVYLDSTLLATTTSCSFALGDNYGAFNVTATDIHENESQYSAGVNSGMLYGDVNANGFVEAYDASLVLQYFCLLPPDGIPLPWAAWRIELADVDGNEMLEAYDASLILRFSLDMIDHFPVENTDGK